MLAAPVDDDRHGAAADVVQPAAEQREALLAQVLDRRRVVDAPSNHGLTVCPSAETTSIAWPGCRARIWAPTRPAIELAAGSPGAWSRMPAARAQCRRPQLPRWRPAPGVGARPRPPATGWLWRLRERQGAPGGRCGPLGAGGGGWRARATSARSACSRAARRLQAGQAARWRSSSAACAASSSPSSAGIAAAAISLTKHGPAPPHQLVLHGQAATAARRASRDITVPIGICATSAISR